MPGHSQEAERISLSERLREAQNIREPFQQTLDQLKIYLTNESSTLAVIRSQTTQCQADLDYARSKNDTAHYENRAKDLNEIKQENERCARQVEELRWRIIKLAGVIRGLDRGIFGLERSIHLLSLGGN